MNASIGTILADLDSLASEGDFRRKFARTFADLGFNTYTYAALNTEDIRGADADMLPSLVYLSNLQPVWIAHYLESGYAHVDPIVRECAEIRLPVVWNEKYRANTRTPDQAHMMDDAWENGIQRGFTVPVHGPGGELGIFSLNSDQSDREFMKFMNLLKFDVQTICTYFHDAVQRAFHVVKEERAPIPLTDRETEILKWTAVGKTAWEIGAILKISERTVNFHIQNVMEKFGVHNKTHAAAKAVNMGLISR
ncbi:MAG: LuxR family transcriptional regulator [Rhodobacteraceae bacterium]|nr:LuxR family transcriptional regulator [Paracoccaceae bacterium]